MSAVQVFENTMEKGDLAPNKQFLLSPQRFQHIWRSLNQFHQIKNSRLQTFSVWKHLKFVVWESVKHIFSLQFICSSINTLWLTLVRREHVGGEMLVIFFSIFHFSMLIFKASFLQVFKTGSFGKGRRTFGNIMEIEDLHFLAGFWHFVLFSTCFQLFFPR